jgi:3-phenylpropionate/cinnamic acid dioxygenase small subunit
VTLEEMLAREGIRQTMAAYTVAGDRLRVDDFVAVFTEDGVMESEGVPEQDLFRYEGREGIRNWMTRWRDQAAAAQGGVHQATFVRHHLATCHIEFVGPSVANVRTYWTAYTDIGADHAGYYMDRFREVNDRWLIAHRRIRLDWRSPGSLMFSAIERSQ